MTAPRTDQFTRVWIAFGSLIAWVVIAFVSLLAYMLRRTNMGSLLRSVSVSRMRQQPLRTSATAFGIALGVAVLAAVTVVNHSIMSGVTATIDDLAGKADLQVSASAAGFPDSLLDQVRNVPGVYTSTPVTEQVASAFGPDGKRERLLMLGVDLLGSEDAYFRSYPSQELEAIRRDQIGFLNSSNNIILGRELADRLKLRLHDKLRVSVGSGVQEFEIWGLVDIEGVGRAFGGAIALMYYPAMQVAFARGRNIDRIDVAVTKGLEIEQVAKALRQRLGPAYSIERPNRRGDRITKMLLAVRTGLMMASLSALLAGAFLVFNTSAIGVIQRRRELGVMRALGTTRRELIRLLTMEGVLVGTVGSALGVLLGIAVSGVLLRWTHRAVNELYIQQGVTDTHIDPLQLFGSFVLGVACTAIAARVATQRASDVQPVEALSSARTWIFSVPAHGLSRVELVGLCLLIATVPLTMTPPLGHIPFGPLAAMVTSLLGVQAFVPRLLGATRGLWAGPSRGTHGASTTLAIDGVYRDLGRSSGMASGVIAGVSLVVCISTFVASFMHSLNTWMTQTVPGDLLVTSGSAVSGLSSRNTPLADNLRDELLAIPGVTQARRMRCVDLQYRDSTVKLWATDMQLYAEHTKITVLSGPEDELRADLQRGQVAVSENFARRFDLKRGDQLALSTTLGMHNYRVAGIVLDYTSDLGTILIDRKTYVEGWGDERVDTYELYLADGFAPDKVRAAIVGGLAQRYDLFVLTNSEFRKEVIKSADQIFVLMRLLEIVTLLVAAMGLMTTVLASVMDRVREIGVFRAIGMLRRQIAAMVVLEAVMVGYLGAVVGIVIGTGTGYIMLVRVMTVQLGWLLPFHLPTPVLILILVTLPIAAAMAGFFPARKAARLQLRDALDYE
jgi:putative ABC transport system permease protein